KGNGIIGNIHSMGLALQALETSSEFYAPRKWDRAQAFSVAYNHHDKVPMAVAQLLPALVGKSYLDSGTWGCAATKGMSPSRQLSISNAGDNRGSNLELTPRGWHSCPVPGGVSQVPTLPLSPSTAPITVQFSITNTLKNYFHYSTSVCVPRKSTLLHVMKRARKEKPDVFRFKTKKTHLGPFVTSIHGLAGNKTKKTYWQFFSCWSPLQEGVGTYKPKNWEHIQAIFSTY
ncbi:IF factor, partial [Pteruthius melanotis]|nr:IF factor [Pteruthius melanotis]